MKNFIITLLFLLYYPCICAQVLQDSIFKDGRRWGYQQGYWAEEYSCYDYHQIQGEKVKNGKKYSEMHFQRTILEGEYFYGAVTEEDRNIIWKARLSMNSIIGIREEDGRVLVDKDEYLELFRENGYWQYIATKDSLPYEVTEDNELVLYDFNKRKGDVYAQAEGGDPIMVIDDEDIIVTEDGLNRRVLLLSNGLKIIEGIGCMNSKGSLLFYLNAKNVFLRYAFLTGYSQQYPSPYGYEGYTGIYSRTYTEQAQEAEEAAIIDKYKITETKNNDEYLLDGRKLKSSPSKGIYIKNGLKKVVSGR